MFTLSIFDYIDKYSVYSFEDVPFNDIDNLIFSSLSYIDFEGIVSINKYNPMTIGNVGKIYFNSHNKMVNDILAVRQAFKIFRAIYNTSRYRDLLLYNYVYETKPNEQFGAVTIELNKNLVYVSFEGTDQMISGWKEDFMLSYKFPVLSQRKAIDYVNRNFLFRHKKIILGGHSKGGNLAVVAGMYANFFVRDKIIKIYNNDGPGLLREQFESRNYREISNKLVQIVPNDCIVGLLLNHSDNYIIVNSSKTGILAHDITTWLVDEISLNLGEFTKFSKKLDSSLTLWIKKYNKNERERFVESLFKIFDELNIDSFVDIAMKKTLIVKIIIGAKDIDKDTKYMLKECVSLIFKCYRDITAEELKMFFNRRRNVNE